MKIKRTTETEYDVKLLGATLLYAEEVETLLTGNERLCRRWWWLRTPGGTPDRAATVNNDGTINYYGDGIANIYGYVRPALKFESKDLQVGDTFKFADEEFKVISENLALCTSAIGYCRFDIESNDYETSEIKQYIDAWFKKNLAKQT